MKPRETTAFIDQEEQYAFLENLKKTQSYFPEIQWKFSNRLGNSAFWDKQIGSYSKKLELFQHILDAASPNEALDIGRCAWLAALAVEQFNLTIDNIDRNSTECYYGMHFNLGIPLMELEHLTNQEKPSRLFNYAQSQLKLTTIQQNDITFYIDSEFLSVEGAKSFIDDLLVNTSQHHQFLSKRIQVCGLSRCIQLGLEEQTRTSLEKVNLGKWSSFVLQNHIYSLLFKTGWELEFPHQLLRELLTSGTELAGLFLSGQYPPSLRPLATPLMAHIANSARIWNPEIIELINTLNADEISLTRLEKLLDIPFEKNFTSGLGLPRRLNLQGWSSDPNLITDHRLSEPLMAWVYPPGLTQRGNTLLAHEKFHQLQAVTIFFNNVDYKVGDFSEFGADWLSLENAKDELLPQKGQLQKVLFKDLDRNATWFIRFWAYYLSKLHIEADTKDGVIFPIGKMKKQNLDETFGQLYILLSKCVRDPKILKRINQEKTSYQLNGDHLLELITPILCDGLTFQQIVETWDHTPCYEELFEGIQGKM